VFVVGELKGVVSGLTTSVNGLRRDVQQGNAALRTDLSGVSARVTQLELDHAKRRGQTSVIAVIVSGGTAILVGVVTAAVKGVLPR
jgi:hypothetical protein